MGAADWSHSASLPAEPGSASRARAFVCHHLVEHRVMRLVDPVRLVVSELATDAVARARTSFTLTLSGVGATVLLEVHDDPSASPQAGVSRVMDTDGHALTIIGVLSRHWGVSTDQNGVKTVWAIFPRSRAALP
jgi:hypothetical protein